MEKFIFTAVMSIILFHSYSAAQDEQIPRYELGVLLGEPTGLSAKYWFDQRFAADAALAWNFGQGTLGIYADYLIHPFRLFGNHVYIGAGATVRAGGDWFLGARFPIGYQSFSDRLPISFFAELAPRIGLLPPAALGLGGGGGIRVVWGKAQTQSTTGNDD